MQNWSILAKFPPQNPVKLAVFVFVSPRNFPWNRPIFLRICLWKSFEIWHFSAKIPRNQPIFLWILTFFPQKYQKSVGFSVNLPLKIPWNFAFFFHEISEALTLHRVKKSFKLHQNEHGVLSAHAPTVECNILHLDKKAVKCRTCRWLCGKWKLFITRKWPENGLNSFKTHFFGKFPRTNWPVPSVQIVRTGQRDVTPLSECLKQARSKWVNKLI